MPSVIRKLEEPDQINSSSDNSFESYDKSLRELTRRPIFRKEETQDFMIEQTDGNFMTRIRMKRKKVKILATTSGNDERK